MKSKAIILDLDGVVVDSPQQKLPTQSLMKVIKKLQKDHYICAATGRVWPFAKDILEALQLKDPCIVAAGTQICNPLTGKVIWQKTLSISVIKKIIKVLKNYPKYKLIYNNTTEDDYFYGGVYPKDFQETKPIFMMNFIFVPHSLAQEISKKLNKIDDVICVLATAQKPGCNDLHIINRQATKENAISELLTRLSVKKENTIGVGDGNNDIHLFNAVGYKVAMENAVDDLKHKADEVIGHVKEDGLAKFLGKKLS